MISRQFKLSIEGMRCSSCVSKIEKNLRKIHGVLSATVNFGLDQAIVSVESEVVQPEQLVQTIQSLSYKATLVQEGKEKKGDPYERELKDWLIRFAIALPLTVILMLIMVKNLGGMGDFPWVAWGLTAPVYAIAGFPFLKGMVLSLWRRHPDMNALIGIGASAALLSGYLETTAMLITFLIIGRLLEARGKKATSQSLRALYRSVPLMAHRSVKGVLEEVSAELLKAGDIIVVKPGEQVPADGKIIKGRSGLDESFITGEALPVSKKEGERIYAGSQNQEGSLTVEVETLGQETYLAQIQSLTEQALANKAPVERLADRVSAVFVPLVLLLAFVTFWSWWHLGPEPKLDTAVTFAIAVLVIACPCALGLATPTAVIAGLGKGSKMGILIKGGDVLEKVRDLHTIMLDKTGTLTEGRPRVREVLIPEGETTDPDEVLRLAAEVENFSEHLLAKAILDEAKKRKIEITEADKFKSYPGLGAKILIEGREILVGSTPFMTENEVAVATLANRVEEKRKQGNIISFVAADKKLIGAIVLEDKIRPGAIQAIQKLKEMDFNVWIITGDQKATAHQVAEKLGISKVISSLSPGEKALAVEEVRKEGLGVAMVGDGINDAPALAKADVGIAMAHGSDLTKQASDITVLRSDPLAVVEAIRLAKRTYNTVLQNLWLSFVYNCAAIPIAAGVFYPAFGWKLSPEIAAVAMSLSSLSVVLNSLRLKWS